MTAPATRTRAPVPRRGVTTVLTVGVPAVVMGIAVAVALTWRPELPDPIATHWGVHGADNFGPLGPHVLAHVVIVAAFGVFMWAVGFFGGRDALTRRIVAGVAVFVASLFAAVLVGNLAIQRGLEDATQVGSADTVIAVALGIGILGAVLAAWATPRDAPLPTSAPLPADAPVLALGRTEQATWVREVGQRAALVIVALVVALATVAVAVTRTWGGPLVLAVALTLLLLVMIRWTVIIDRTGLTARSVLRRPRIHISLDEVVVAEEVEVSPLRDFGGWGLRRGRQGRTGVVLRAGDALQIRRTGDRVLVVTVDDAATGAALLNALAARART